MSPRSDYLELQYAADYSLCPAPACGSFGNVGIKLALPLEDTVSQKQTMESAKRAYRRVGLVSGMIGGLIASQGYRQIWKRVARNGDPQPLSTAYPLKEILISSAVQGAIYALVKTIIDRSGARLFERVTGEWPGD